MIHDLEIEDYRALAEFRYRIRKFLTFSEQEARVCGITPQQHQLLLTIRGLPEVIPPLVGALAERIGLRHHSTVELIDRLERQGYLTRQYPAGDRRQVSVKLTTAGKSVLRKLSIAHREELRTAAPDLVAALAGITATDIPPVGENER